MQRTNISQLGTIAGASRFKGDRSAQIQGQTPINATVPRVWSSSTLKAALKYQKGHLSDIQI